MNEHPPQAMAPRAFDLPPALAERVYRLVATAHQVQAVGARRMPTRLLFGLAGVVVVCAAVSAVSQRQLNQVTSGDFVRVTTAVTLLAITALAVALAPGKRGLGASIIWLAAIATLAAPVYAIATAVAPVLPRASALVPPSVADSLRMSASCAAIACGTGAVALAALVHALRHAVPTAVRARGAAVGAAAGVAAGVALHVFCPHFDRVHLVIGHAVPIAVFAFLGALLTPRWLRP